MKLTFKKSDVVDQESLEKDIQATYERLLKRNSKRRTPEQIYKDTEQGLVLEYYLMQNDPKFKKATQLNEIDYYHDLIDTTTNEIHECKVTSSYMGWEGFWVQNKIRRILEEGWNHSKYFHLAIYNNKTKVYTYKGMKQIR